MIHSSAAASRLAALRRRTDGRRPRMRAAFVASASPLLVVACRVDGAAPRHDSPVAAVVPSTPIPAWAPAPLARPHGL